MRVSVTRVFFFFYISVCGLYLRFLTCVGTFKKASITHEVVRTAFVVVVIAVIILDVALSLT
jgi:hypothetical protein